MAAPPRPSRAIALTFDNLGEASELQRGEPVAARGGHPSVTVVLPRLLDELDAVGLHATFFVEAINCELHPEAVRLIAARGHELGVHGFCHEPWAELEAERERSLLDRSVAAFAALDLSPRGFRPPGGQLTPRSSDLLRERGFTWCSALGEREPFTRGGLAWVPFRWELVDAYHLMPAFASLRRRSGDPEAPLQPACAAQRLRAALADPEGPRTLILHPFLMLDPGWWVQTRRLLAILARDSRARIVPGGALASAARGA